MSDVLNEYMRAHRMTDWNRVKCIECNDGFRISVQGHDGAYCKPRIDHADAYYLVECGFPSGPVPELREYKDGKELADEETVYGYVPISKVIALLDAHGGIKGPYEDMVGAS